MVTSKNDSPTIEQRRLKRATSRLRIPSSILLAQATIVISTYIRRRERRLSFGLCDLVIFSVLVHSPGIAILIHRHIPRRDERRGHRVILVVIAMLPVSADAVEVLDRAQPGADLFQMLLISGVVDRIRLWHTHDVSLDQLPARQANLVQLFPAERDELVV